MVKCLNKIKHIDINSFQSLYLKYAGWYYSSLWLNTSKTDTYSALRQNSIFALWQIAAEKCGLAYFLETTCHRAQMQPRGVLLNVFFVTFLYFKIVNRAAQAVDFSIIQYSLCEKIQILKKKQLIIECCTIASSRFH